MRSVAGQVAREAHRALHLLLGLAILLLLGTGVLAWRLSQGPIPVPYLARIVEEQANAPDAEGQLPPTRLEIGEAAIGWSGWRNGSLTPVAVLLSGFQMRGPDGVLRLNLPNAAVTLSLPWLLRGEMAPQRVELDRPSLRLRRAPDGAISVRLGAVPEESQAPGADATRSPADDIAAAEEQSGIGRIITELMRAPSDATPMSALRLLRLRDGHAVVEDAALGLTWIVDDIDLTLRRRPGGGIEGQASAMLLLGGERVALRASADITAAETAGGPADIAFRLLLPALRPALLAASAPRLAPLAGLDATVDLELGGRIDTQGGVQSLRATLSAGAGALDLGAAGRVPMRRLELALDATPERVQVSRGVLVLDGTASPTLTLAGEANRGDAGWRGAATVGLDTAQIGDLGRYWPETLAPKTRVWLVENLTAGTARDGQWRFTGEAAADLSAPRLTGLSGTLEVQDATVHWLRPVPPAEGASGTVTFGLEEISMQVTGGRQSGGAMRVRDGTVRFLLPPEGQETTEMSFNLAGPVPDAVAVLKHPRLHLFDRQPFPVKDPRGQIEARLQLAFPLLADLPTEHLQVRVQGRIRQVRLADLLLGRPLEAALVEINVTNAGLTASSRAARLGGITGQMQVDVDFRAGPPGQVVRRETVRATTDVATLAALDLALPDLMDGPVSLDISSETRRNGQGRATVRADLRATRLMLDPLAWSKPAGQAATGEMVLRLEDDKLQAIDSFQVQAPDLRIRGNAGFAASARLRQVTITEGAVEESRFAAEITPPREAGGPWGLSLRGPTLDLRRTFEAEMARSGPDEAPESSPGTAFDVTARFQTVLLGARRNFEAVQARVRLDGHGVVRSGALSGEAGPGGGFQMEITPSGAGRSLQLTAQDAGALLERFDVLRDLRGGRLTVQASYPSNRPGAPLTGTAEMQDFSVHNAPSFAKLLQAMTLYGLVEAVSGPGLAFNQLIAPFTLTPSVLTLREARAFSASLGLTAKGTLNRRTKVLAMEGTIVPAYFFNSLLGNIPILGRLFSPEAGGGLFAATFRMNGPAEDPQVSVNPLAALTPGFLRGLFQIGQGR